MSNGTSNGSFTTTCVVDRSPGSTDYRRFNQGRQSVAVAVDPVGHRVTVLPISMGGA